MHQKYSKIPTIRGEGERRCLELPKISDYKDYDGSEPEITRMAWHTHLLVRTRYIGLPL
jgi:hypothetical protein